MYLGHLLWAGMSNIFPKYKIPQNKNVDLKGACQEIEMG